MIFFENQLLSISQIKANIIANSKTYYLYHEEAKVNIALALRELFRYFLLIGKESFPDVLARISEEDNYRMKYIVFSDYIGFCPQENSEFFQIFI